MTFEVYGAYYERMVELAFACGGNAPSYDYSPWSLAHRPGVSRGWRRWSLPQRLIYVFFLVSFGEMWRCFKPPPPQVKLCPRFFVGNPNQREVWITKMLATVQRFPYHRYGLFERYELKYHIDLRAQSRANERLIWWTSWLPFWSKLSFHS